MTVHQYSAEEVKIAVEVVMPRYEDIAHIINEESYRRAEERVAKEDAETLLVKALVSYLHVNGYLKLIFSDPMAVYLYRDEGVKARFREGLRKLLPELPEVMEVKGHVYMALKDRPAVEVKVPVKVRFRKEAINPDEIRLSELDETSEVHFPLPKLTAKHPAVYAVRDEKGDVKEYVIMLRLRE